MGLRRLDIRSGRILAAVGLLTTCCAVSPAIDLQEIAEARQSHWAFQPIRKSAVPQVTSVPPATLIDSFVLSALEQNGLSMASPADKRALLKRATLDLHGLPPTWEEVEAFLQDDTPAAFEHVIDRLLASPRYGERWGRHWLDLARYADTHGGAALGIVKFPFSYTYRDYVIKAFQQDLPYNQFLMEQIAADQIEPLAKPEALAGLGFLTVGRQFSNAHDIVDDRIDVVTRGLMGLTVACARCHDHKYDAIPTDDYYSLYAVMAVSEPPQELPLIETPADSAEFREYSRRLKETKLIYQEFVREHSEVLRHRLRRQVGAYLIELAKGAPENDLSEMFLSYRTEDIRPEILERWRTYLAEQTSENDPVFGPWRRLAKLSEGQFSAQARKILESLQAENDKLDPDPIKDHRLVGGVPKWNPRVLEALLATPLASMVDVAKSYGDLFTKAEREWQEGLDITAKEAELEGVNIGDDDPLHLSVNNAVNRQLRHYLYAPGTPLAISDEEARPLLNRPITDTASRLRGAIKELDLQLPGAPPRAMSLVENRHPKEQPIFESGNPLSRGANVPARFLRVLTGSEDEIFPNGTRRKELAKAIVDPANPLTSRVLVNWVWLHHFGAGLVRSPDNFGVRGETPTHPELLDYLAAEFIEEGWSLKKLHRKLMLSAAYQQAAHEIPACRAKDPDNRLLWRMPPRPLEFEALRDVMLYVAGRLDEARGGRPFDLLALPSIPRRTAYGFVNRDVIPSLFSTFDVADPNSCSASRPQTIVPQRGLFALNSEFVQEQALHLASLSDVQQAATDEDRMEVIFRRVYARRPSASERAAALEYVRTIPPASTPSPWQRLAQVLLVSNEFLYVE